MNSQNKDLLKYYYQSPLGWLELQLGPSGLEGLEILGQKSLNQSQNQSQKLQVEKANSTTHKLLPKVIKQLDDYFAGRFSKISLKLQPVGTDFQKQVWQAMARIPKGKTRSYALIAQDIGRPKAYRAVANACGANPLPIVIPCHRVVASHGLGGFSSGINHKKWLLKHEGVDWEDLSIR